MHINLQCHYVSPQKSWTQDKEEEEEEKCHVEKVGLHQYVADVTLKRREIQVLRENTPRI
jgi:hypothetical protein